MVCHILCPHCANDLSDIYPFYQEVQKGFNAQILKQQRDDLNPEKMFLNTKIQTSFNFIFEFLGLNLQCCRIALLGCVDFDI